MKSLSPRLMIFLSTAFGGGSLIAFAYFLGWGTPFPIGIARSDTARLSIDSLLCLTFFLQHSGMIRRSAKQRIGRWIPVNQIPALYSIASGVALLALVVLWQPTDHALVRLGGPLRWVSTIVSAAAVAGFAWGVHALREFDPFGTLALKAVLGNTPVPQSLFVARGPYRIVRHPLYLFILILIWCVPSLSADRLLFNLLWTAWIVVGTKLEERDLLADFGEVYREYQRSVPMLIPLRRP